MRLFYLCFIFLCVFFEFKFAVKDAMESHLFSAVVASPFGYMGIRSEAECLLELVYLPPRFQEKSPSDAISANLAQQMERYFDDPDFQFQINLPSVGSAFQNRVWQAINAIPRGQVQTYGQVAKHIRSAPRAVGQACGANRFPLIIPCHRVVAAQGLGGFAHDNTEDGFYLRVKKFLLDHEQARY
jgi:methylated-DNA-[protein]-cysteine S-methyltransferase